MVNKATMLVSRPNQTRVDIEWTAGTVSKTVIIADKMIRDVLNIWKTKAAGDEAGCSSSRYNDCFHGGWISSASSSSAFWATMFDGDTGGECSSVKWVRLCSGGGLLKRLSSIVDVEAIRP
jgi:hypothetical protein